MSIGVKILILLALCAGAVLGYNAWEYHVDQRGYKRANAEWEKKEAGIKADAAEKLATATNTARAREQKLLADMNGMSIIRFEENDKHEKAMDTLRARARAGDERLRVAVTRRSVCPGAPGRDTDPTAGSVGETRADLMPGTTDRIFSIAGRITSLVRDYNAVVDAYNAARETCNQQ